MHPRCKPRPNRRSPAPLMVRFRAATNAVRLCGGSATTLCTGCSSGWEKTACELAAC